jgi:hypothetical protein
MGMHYRNKRKEQQVYRYDRQEYQRDIIHHQQEWQGQDRPTKTQTGANKSSPHKQQPDYQVLPVFQAFHYRATTFSSYFAQFQAHMVTQAGL